MKLLILLIAATFLSGCGNLKRLWTGITGEASEFCYKGVSYLQFPSGASVQYDREGKIVNCN